MIDTRLDERRRLRTFAVAAAILSAATLALTWANRPQPTDKPTVDAAPTQPSPPPSRAAVAIGTPPRARAQEPKQPSRRLRATASRFLRSYLPYLYGQAPLRTVQGASLELRRRLARERRRVPPAARRRRPRARTLRRGGLVQDARAWRVTARVADGDVATYPIELLIANRGGRLVVIQTGGE